MRGNRRLYLCLLETCNASITNPLIKLSNLFPHLFQNPQLFVGCLNIPHYLIKTEKTLIFFWGRSNQFSCHESQHFYEAWYNKSMSWMGKYCYHCDSKNLYIRRVFEKFKNPKQMKKLIQGINCLPQEVVIYILAFHFSFNVRYIRNSISS